MSWWTTLPANEALSRAGVNGPEATSRRRWALPLRISVLLVGCLLAVHAVSVRRSSVASPAPIHVGHKLPALELRDTEGNGVSIRGKTALLFFKTGCRHCERALSALRARARDYSEAHLDVLAVCLDGRDRAQAFAHSQNLPFPVVVGSMEAFAASLGEKAVPVLYLVDSTQSLQYRRVGGFGASEEGDLVRLLSRQADSGKLDRL